MDITQFAHGAADGLMQGKEGGGGEQVALVARAPQADAQGLRRVLRTEWLDAQASGETRVEGAVAPQGGALVEFVPPTRGRIQPTRRESLLGSFAVGLACQGSARRPNAIPVDARALVHGALPGRHYLR